MEILNRIYNILLYACLRIAALLLDFILVGGVSITFAYYLADENVPFPVHFTLCFASICAIFESNRWQATPGKKIVGLRVQAKNGEDLFILQSFIRRGIWLLAFGPIITSFFFKVNYQFMIGFVLFTAAMYLPIFFTNQHTSIVDMLSKTRVIKYRTGVISKLIAVTVALGIGVYGYYVYEKTEGELRLAVKEVRNLRDLSSIKATALLYISKFVDLDVEEIIVDDNSDAPPDAGRGFTVATASALGDKVVLEFKAVDPYEVGVYVNGTLIHHRQYGSAPQKTVIDIRPHLRFGNNFIATRAKISGNIEASEEIHKIMKTTSYIGEIWREYKAKNKKQRLGYLNGPGPEVPKGEWNYKAKRFVVEENVDFTQDGFVDIDGNQLQSAQYVDRVQLDKTQFGKSRFKRFFHGHWEGKRIDASGFADATEALIELKVDEKNFEMNTGDEKTRRYVYKADNTGPGVYMIDAYTGTLRETMKITKRGADIQLKRQNGFLYELSRKGKK